jgi:hypothetical protein
MTMASHVTFLSSRERKEAARSEREARLSEIIEAAVAVEEVPEVVGEQPFVPDGDLMTDGRMRWRVLCDTQIRKNGLFFREFVSPGAPEEEYRDAQRRRDEALVELAELTKRL